VGDEISVNPSDTELKVNGAGAAPSGMHDNAPTSAIIFERRAPETCPTVGQVRAACAKGERLRGSSLHELQGRRRHELAAGRADACRAGSHG